MRKMRALAFALLALPVIASAADTLYVSDQLEITMRAGEGTRYKITSMLESGMALEVLSENKKSGYTRVRTPGGKVGYVLSRQLMDQPSVREQLVSARENISQLRAEPDQIRSRLIQLKSDYESLQKRYTAVSAEKKGLTEELAGIRQTASNAITIAKERTELRMQVTELTRQVADLQQQNRDHKNNQSQRWFMIGAAVILLGILLGLILPKLHLGRQRSSWSDL